MMEIPIHFQQVYLFPNDAAKWLFTTEPMICCGDFVVLKKTNWCLEIKVNYLENAKQMKTTTIENKLFSLSSLVFGTFDKDDGGSNDNVKHMHHHNNDCNGKSKKKRLRWAKQQPCMFTTLFITSLWRSLHDFNEKRPNATFYGGHWFTLTFCNISDFMANTDWSRFLMVH